MEAIEREHGVGMALSPNEGLKHDASYGEILDSRGRNGAKPE